MIKIEILYTVSSTKMREVVFEFEDSDFAHGGIHSSKGMII